MQLVCQARARLANRSKTVTNELALPLRLGGVDRMAAMRHQFSVEYPSRVATLLTNYAKRAPEAKRHVFELILTRSDFPDEFVRLCRDVGTQTTLVSVDNEMRRFGIDRARGELICDRMRPSSRAQFIPSSLSWFDALVAHMRAAKPRRVFVLYGRSGCGKTCMIEPAATESGIGTTKIYDAGIEEVDEKLLWESVLTRARRPRRDGRSVVILLDNAEYLRLGALAMQTLKAIASMDANTARVVLVVIVNNWYARGGGVVEALRRQFGDNEKQLALQRRNSKHVVKIPFEIVLRHCEPAPSVIEIAAHLKRCVPNATPTLCSLIANECGGDIRCAMQRLDIESRLLTATPMRNVTTTDRFSSQSIAVQLRQTINTMSRDRKPAEDVDFCSPLEGDYQTMAMAETAEELLFAGYARVIPSTEDRNVLADLDAMACVVDNLSLVDTIRTTERQQCFVGSHAGITLAVGVTSSCKRLSARPLPTWTGAMTMDFKRLTTQTRTRENTAMLASLYSTYTGGTRVTTTSRGDSDVKFTHVGVQSKQRGYVGASISFDAFECVVALASYQSAALLTDYALRIDQSLKLSASSIAMLGRLRGAKKSNMLTAYEQTLRIAHAQKSQTLEIVKKLPATHRADTLSAAAFRCAGVGLNEDEFVRAVQFVDSLRFAGDSTAEQEKRTAKAITKAEAVKVYRASRVAHKQELGKRQRVNADEPATKKSSSGTKTPTTRATKTPANDDDN